MPKTWKLKRVRQCAKCPWKISTNPHDIPNGYSEEQHKALTSTIAAPGLASLQASEMHAMSCHEHAAADEAYCVGWLMNQIGPGNNLPLRIKMLNCENFGRISLDGPQHKRLEDTFPDQRRQRG